MMPQLCFNRLTHTLSFNKSWQLHCWLFLSYCQTEWGLSKGGLQLFNAQWFCEIKQALDTT